MTDNIPPSEPLVKQFDSDPLHGSGIEALTPESSTNEIESALRRLRELTRGSDSLLRITVREAAIRRLRKIGFSSPASMVDAALGERRGDGRPAATQGRAVQFSDPELWDEPVNGVRLLGEMVDAFASHIILPDGAAVAIALWVLHAHALDASLVSPILALLSPVKQCGKTNTLALLHALVPRSMSTSNITPAAVFRTVEKFTPTLLIDEADSFLGAHEELRGVLNSGHFRPGAFVTRCIGEGHEPSRFATWCPKALAAIGRLPATLEDRAIVIPMRRKSPGERVQRVRLDRLDALEPLRRKAARWAQDNMEGLRGAEPEMPSHLQDRAQDNWRALFAIADLAGGDWPKVAREAASALSGPAKDTGDSEGEHLLADIRGLFITHHADRLPSAGIVEALAQMETRSWGEWRGGKPITPIQLARMLKPFGIAPTTIRTGTSTPKGYTLDQFTDAFDHYLPPPDPQHPQQANNDALSRAASIRNTDDCVADGGGDAGGVSTHHGRSWPTPLDVDSGG